MRTVAILAGLALAVPAHATSGLEWQWDEAERVYHILGEVQLPELVWLRAFNNKEVRLSGFRLELMTTCKAAEAAGKKAWEVHCRIDDVSLQAVRFPGDPPGTTDEILVEWDERLTGKHVELLWRKDGRIRDVGWVDLVRRNRRDGENIEVMRQLMVRAFAPLDLELPKKGDDGGTGAWDQGDTLLLTLPSSGGTVGGTQVTHTIAAEKDGVVKVGTAGEGTISNAQSIDTTAGQANLANTYKMTLRGEAMFDTGQGHLLKREVLAAGAPTASSNLADAFAGLPYVQAFRVDLVPAGTAAALPPSKEIPQLLDVPAQ